MFRLKPDFKRKTHHAEYFFSFYKDFCKKSRFSGCTAAFLD